ncbi:hypothetical protein BCI9360_00225 [Bacillus sp. CECT 9360]|nr:hypothetical protein BCI9360_00225 [Bacillus sp. CECT 9360]
MGFYWVGLIFWLLIAVSCFLFLYGLVKKSWKSLIISGIAFSPIALYFSGSENSYRLLGILPLVLFILAIYIRKRVKHS